MTASMRRAAARAHDDAEAARKEVEDGTVDVVVVVLVDVVVAIAFGAVGVATVVVSRTIIVADAAVDASVSAFCLPTTNPTTSRSLFVRWRAPRLACLDKSSSAGDRFPS